MTVQKPILTGLHALLCPELIYTGFKVFSPEKINLLCSVTHTGSFTDPGKNFNKSCKKAKGLLPLTFLIYHLDTSSEFYDRYKFDIRTQEDIVTGCWIQDMCWNADEDLDLYPPYSEEYPIWEAVQKFEKEMQAKYDL